MNNLFRAFLSLFAKIYIYVVPKFSSLVGKEILKKIRNQGPGCRIDGYCSILNEQNLVLGKHVQIGKNAYFACHGGLDIGDYTHLSRNVTIYTRNHDINSSALPYDDTFVFKPVSIGKYVWIGMNVCITPGVKIGDGAVIGMGTIVSKDVEPNEILVGSANRIVGIRDQDSLKQNLKLRRFWGKNRLVIDDKD